MENIIAYLVVAIGALTSVIVIMSKKNNVNGKNGYGGMIKEMKETLGNIEKAMLVQTEILKRQEVLLEKLTEHLPQRVADEIELRRGRK